MTYRLRSLGWAPFVIALVALPLVAQSENLPFSGLKAQVEQTLQSALAQTAVLKSLWTLPSAFPGAVVQTALARDGRPLVVVLSPDRLSLQAWSVSPAQRWGDALTLAGEPITQFSIAWGEDQSAWIAWSGLRGAQVATWSGLAWVRVALPDADWKGPLFWTSGLRLWGTSIRDSEFILNSVRRTERTWKANSRSEGRRMSPLTTWRVFEVGKRLLLAVAGKSGALFEAHPNLDDQWVDLSLPETLLSLPELGVSGSDLAVLVQPGAMSRLWTLSPAGAWQQHDEAPGFTALSRSPALLMATSGNGKNLALHQLDGESWRVPLPLRQLVDAEDPSAGVQFLPPPGSAKSGVLVIGTSGWELP